METEDENLLEGENSLEDAVTFLRGQILSDTIAVERRIDDFLSLYFCASNEKKNEICELLFYTERISFDIKKQILYAILNSHFKTFIKEYPDLISGLEDTAPHRNIFAHLEVDKQKSSPGDISKKPIIVFKRYKGGKNKPVIYTPEDIHKIARNLVRVDVLLQKLITAMPPLA